MSQTLVSHSWVEIADLSQGVCHAAYIAVQDRAASSSIPTDTEHVDVQ